MVWPPAPSPPSASTSRAARSTPARARAASATCRAETAPSVQTKQAVAASVETEARRSLVPVSLQQMGRMATG
eukprot:12287594-Alexandrium_andersonii.AAC.1